MINILLEGFDIDAPWLYDELKNYIQPNHSVAVVAFSFRDNRVKSLSDWNALYSKECGKYHDGIVGGFTTYGIPEENINFINYFTDTKIAIAGKSGTAQVVSIKQGEKYNASRLKVEHRDNALFVAYAPFKHPRILVAVILENEGGGSTKAAPVARAIIDKYLLDLYPNGYMGDPNPQVVKFGMGGSVVLQ